MPFKDPQLDLWNDFDKAGPQERPEHRDAQESFEPVFPLEREVIDPIEDDKDFEEARRQADKITAAQEAAEAAKISKHDDDLEEVRRKMEKTRNWAMEADKKLAARRYQRKNRNQEGKERTIKKPVFNQEFKRQDSGHPNIRKSPEVGEKKPTLTAEEYEREAASMYNEKDPMGDIYPAFGKRFR